jgi:hypothetical protein
MAFTPQVGKAGEKQAGRKTPLQGCNQGEQKKGRKDIDAPLKGGTLEKEGDHPLQVSKDAEENQQAALQEGGAKDHKEQEEGALGIQ